MQKFYVSLSLFWLHFFYNCLCSKGINSSILWWNFKTFVSTNEWEFHHFVRGKMSCGSTWNYSFLIVNFYDLIVEFVSQGVYVVKSVAFSMAYNQRNSGSFRYNGKWFINQALDAILVAIERCSLGLFYCEFIFDPSGSRSVQTVCWIFMKAKEASALTVDNFTST